MGRGEEVGEECWLEVLSNHGPSSSLLENSLVANNVFPDRFFWLKGSEVKWGPLIFGAWSSFFLVLNMYVKNYEYIDIYICMYDIVMLQWQRFSSGFFFKMGIVILLVTSILLVTRHPGT